MIKRHEEMVIRGEYVHYSDRGDGSHDRLHVTKPTNPYTLNMCSLLHVNMNIKKAILKRWMNLEPIIQSEVSQKEKDKYHILTHIYGI